ncbi:MAG: ATP-grasp domain-containing protein [Chloroflexota bacterium]|nr:ATP-grasp domain-containing protein [Chloroflexota bacterium]
MKVLITDCDSKHSIALQRYIGRALPQIHLIGHSDNPVRFARYFGYCREYIERLPLEAAISLTNPNMIIPVGGRSVQAVQSIAPDRAVLPAAESLRRAYDKGDSTSLAAGLGISVPRTIRVRSEQDVDLVDVVFPCVVKPANEIDGKFVVYPRDRGELKEAVRRGLSQLGATPGALLIQEYVSGVGAGFFALYQGGEIRRMFMHRRIREWPLSGGASTAARAIRDESLMQAGAAILDALQWNGVAMVEFKFRTDSRDYVFIEVNPKFWGSCELALAAGVNFGADLIRVYRGESLRYDETYNDILEFYWPLDDDLLGLIARHDLGNVRQYFGPNAKTNVRQSIRADALKTVRLTIKIAQLLRSRS